MNSFHQVYTTVQFPTSRRMVKMSFMAISFVWFLSTLFGMAGYLSLGQNLLTIDLFPSRPALANSDDFANKFLKSGNKSLEI
jgi:hypothetical protein